MRPTTSPCPHCGMERDPWFISIGGKDVQAGYVPCFCPGAEAARLKWEETERRKAAEKEELARERRLARSGIPRRYSTAEHPLASKIAESVRGGRGAYLHGPNGSGKTHLACAAALIAMSGGVDVRFAVVPSLLESIRTRKSEADELVRSLSRCGLLVLDDLGKEAASTPYSCERLFDVVNSRYNAMLPVVVTSNFPRGDVARRVSEGAIGDAIASRLCEMTDSILIDGEDMRIRRNLIA